MTLCCLAMNGYYATKNLSTLFKGLENDNKKRTQKIDNILQFKL